MRSDDYPVVWFMVRELHWSRATPKVGSFGLAVVDKNVHRFWLQENLEFTDPLCHEGTWTNDKMGERGEIGFVGKKRPFHW